MNQATKVSVRTSDSLGKVVYAMKPNTSNVISGFVLGVGLTIGGLSLAGYLLRQMFFGGSNPPQDASGWIGAGVLTLLGMLVAVGGALLVFYARSLIGLQLHVCADGFWFHRGSQQWVFAWDEIVRVRESVIEEKLPIAQGPARRIAPTKTTRTYSVERCDGEEFYFDENVIPRTSLLAGPLAAAAKARGISWETDGGV